MAQIHCSRCGGTGLVSRGQVINGVCFKCRGDGKHRPQHRASKITSKEYDHVNKSVCGKCGGVNSTQSQPANRYDTMPDEIWQSFEFRVIRQDNRPQTWAEAYLGLGSVFSVTDYGRHKSMLDEALIESVRASQGHQACKVTREDETVATFIAILANNNGYTVLPVFEGSK